jgi:hypothetical protein
VGCGLITAAQKEWALTQAFVMKVKPGRRFSCPETSMIRAIFFDLVMPDINLWIDCFIVGIININCACIATASFGAVR